MSKIGRRPIAISKAKVTIENRKITLKGPKGELTHEIPAEVQVVQKGDSLVVTMLGKKSRKASAVWGLHRALLANKVKGVEEGFVKNVRIEGLGFKVQVATPKNLTFSLGYSHKIEYKLPADVSIEVDKKGQAMVLSSIDKFSLGNVCDALRSLRLYEPYKGTGIIRDGDVLLRKAGKTKAG